MILLTHEKAQQLLSKGFSFDYPERMLKSQPFVKKETVIVPGGCILPKKNNDFLMQPDAGTRTINLQDLITWMNNRFSYQIKQTKSTSWRGIVLLDKEDITLEADSLADLLYNMVLTALSHDELPPFTPAPTFEIID